MLLPRRNSADISCITVNFGAVIKDIYPTIQPHSSRYLNQLRLYFGQNDLAYQSKLICFV
jgi:hypothetical protein